MSVLVIASTRTPCEFGRSGPTPLTNCLDARGDDPLEDFAEDGFAVDASLIEADANKSRSLPGREWSKEIDPATASRSVRDYLATLDEAAYGKATTVTPKFVSPSDPAAQ
jgi:hypothetical protein